MAYRVANEEKIEGAPADRRRWLSLIILSLSLALIIIDSTIVNVAIPTIRGELQASLRDVEWVNSIYSLVFAAFLITWGRLGDQFGRRRIFMAGIVLFVTGSLVAGSAPSVPVLVLARVLQGFGAAMMSPSTLSILSSTFKGRERGFAFGVWGATAGAAGALGPLLGGWLITNASWRWAFWINVPVGLAAILGTYFIVQESRGEVQDKTGQKSRLDIVGIVLSTLGLGALVFGLIEGQTYGWWMLKEPISILGWNWPVTQLSIIPFVFGISAIFLAAFVLYELRQERAGKLALFEFGLLRYPGFRYGLITTLIVALGEFGLIFVLSLFLQGVRGLSAWDTGLAFLPFAGITLVIAPVAGILSSRIGPKWVVTIGMGMEAVAIFWLSRILAVDLPVANLLPPLMLYGAGIGMAIAQLGNIVLSDIPPAKAGAGSGANNTLRQIGASLGIALLGTVLVTTITTTGQEAVNSSNILPPPLKAQVMAQLESGGFDATGPQGGAGNNASSRIAQAAAPQTGVNQGAASAAQAQAAIGQEMSRIIKNASTEGARRAGVLAALFVALGALSSLRIPATGRGRRGERSYAAEVRRAGGEDIEVTTAGH